jgi:hypothetical protein
LDFRWHLPAVFLEATPKTFIDYVGIDAKADGNFAMQVNLNRDLPGLSVITTITDVNKKVIETSYGTPIHTTTSFVISGQVNNIKPWTSETPNCIMQMLFYKMQPVKNYMS